jgi:predicted Zn finger-like uncharacterized protein
MSAKKPSLITSCPACAASFYVTPEQLSAYRGEVRCGKCSHVFNALDRLSESPEDSPTPKTAAEAGLAAIPVAPAEQPQETAGIIEPTPSSPVADSSVAAFNIADFSAKPSSTADSPKIVADVASKTRLNRSRKRKPSVWPLALLALVFAFLAAAQAAYHMRTQVVAQWPVLKPHFDKACEFLDCTVELPKQIELLAIDDYDLQEDAKRQGLIHFSSTIINNAAFAQAYPLLELTLTDADDKPVLRHAFTPREYLPAGTDISQGLAAGEELHVSLALTASGEAVAGYRVFVTYP